MKTETVFPVHDVSALDMAFGGGRDLMSKLLPPYADIPAEFKDGHTPWNKLFAAWFYCGLSALERTEKPGIEKAKALRHIRTVMGSFEPKHEHKEAGVAYLLSQWFTDPKWEQNKRQAE